MVKLNNEKENLPGGTECNFSKPKCRNQQREAHYWQLKEVTSRRQGRYQ